MRHSSLIPLSHDHHEALLVALRLKKGGPTSPNDRLWPKELPQQVHSLELFFERELLPHFFLEEDVLFPAALALEEMRDTIDTLRSQHERMRLMMAQLPEQQDENQLKKDLADFGALLEAHVRIEERKLFPKLEEAEREGRIAIPKLK